MIARIWTTGLRSGREAAYEAFARETSLPMFEAHDGYLGCAMWRDGTQATVVTFWSTLADIEALGGSRRYNDTVAAILQADLLTGPQTVTVNHLHLLNGGVLGDRA